MQLPEYVKSKGGTATPQCSVMAQIALAAACSVGSLYLICLGHRKPSHALAARIERATEGAVTRVDLRPDIFGPAQEAA